MTTKSEQTNKDITALLRARNTLLWVVTREELRVERAIIDAAAKAKYPTVFWDCATGLSDSDGEIISDTRDPGYGSPRIPGLLRTIEDEKVRRVYVARDMHKWFDPVVLRGLRTLAKSLQGAPADEARTIIILTPSADVPLELSGHATVIDYPLPERKEIAAVLDETIAGLQDAVRQVVCADLERNGTRDRAIDAAIGLTTEEAGNCYAKSLVTATRIAPSLVSNEKKRVIAREKVLTWIDPDPMGMAGIGGLENLKSWLTNRRQAFSQRARDYGLPAPKGVLLVGVSGCGKSLTPKCVSFSWQMPLLRLDMGALKSKWVGESEENIRRALATAEAVAPCVLWLDEVEKALGGATQGAADGGVSSDALGAILSWMQDRVGAVFVVATANDIEALPPEFLRKGRFDELFFVDVPTRDERGAILAASLKRHGIVDDIDDLDDVVRATEGFTGAEINAIVPDAMFTAFADSERQIDAADLTDAASMVVPLTKTAGDKIGALRKWAKGRARFASIAEESKASVRALDIA